MARISRHAAERYVERIAPHLTCEQAEAIMLRSARVIDAAAAFGCKAIKLSCGARLTLVGDMVVTVRQPFMVCASDTMMKKWKRDVKARRSLR